VIPVVVGNNNCLDMLDAKALEVLNQALKSEEKVYSKWSRVVTEAMCKPPLTYKLKISSINRKVGIKT